MKNPYLKKNTGSMSQIKKKGSKSDPASKSKYFWEL